MFYKKFGIEKNSITGITGSGGKTSLMFLLAEELSKFGKVLATTTTKIFVPKKNQYETLILTDCNKIFKGSGKNIDVLGLKIKDGKLFSPTEEDIYNLQKKYDYILYEGDGSKRKMMKFWKENEPCILSKTSLIIGVGNIKILGKDFNEGNVHRFNMYMDNNKISTNDFNKFIDEYNFPKKIDKNILLNFLKSGKFFGENYHGRKMIFLNGVEEENELSTALEFSRNLSGFCFGSVKERKIYTPEKISAVVMGSGKSERFGRNKLLEKINGFPMIEILLKKLEDLPFEKVFATYKDEKILKIYKKYNVIPLENKKYFLGQSESIKLGVENTKDGSFMFFTGDMPFLTVKTIEKIIIEFYKNGGITVPRVKGHNSPPVIFPEKYRDELLKLHGDRGGREIIKKAENINFVDFADEKEFIDIDTAEEFYNLKGENQ